MASVLRVETPAIFSFEQAFHFLTRSPDEILHLCSKNSVNRILFLDGRIIFIKVSFENANGLLVEIPFEDLSLEEEELIKNYLRVWFDLNTDLSPFYRLVKEHFVLGPLTHHYYGYRVVGFPDFFESLVWTILGQQINLRFAYSLKRRFIENFGKSRIYEENTYYTFPTPGDVASSSIETLQALQFSKQKADYIIGVARAIQEGTLSFDMIKDMSFEEAKTNLLKIKGIGDWTANYLLMKTFHFPQAFPVGDAGLANAVKKIMQIERKPTVREIVSFFEPFKGWEAYVTLYLWRSL